MSASKSWKEIVTTVAERTGIYREDGILWPTGWRRSRDRAVRDNIIYNIAGHASQELRQRGYTNVSEHEILACVYALLCDKDAYETCLKHISTNGWGNALP